MINYRSELVKMLKYLRKVLRGHLTNYNGPLRRRTFKSTYLCSNGQDAEAIYLRDSLTAGELKKFLKDIPDDLTVDAFEDMDYDDCTGDIILRFEYDRKHSDEQYYCTIKQWYESELAKEKVKILPVPTEEEYHEMLAKIKRYNDAKSNFGSC